MLIWSPTTSAGTYAYGILDAGQSASQTFTLTNSGTTHTAALTITLTGSAAFTTIGDTCKGEDLKPNESCDITIRFAPATAGQEDSATVTATISKSAATASLALDGASAKAKPAIATSAGAGGTVGTATVTDTAILSGGASPTGIIEFQLYGPSPAAVCSGTAVFDKTVNVSGDGSYASPSFTPAQAGTYWWTASYGGDAANTAAASGCGDESVAISQGSPALATNASAGTTVGTAVIDTATLAGGASPTGVIEFQLYGPSPAAVCSGTAVFDKTVNVSGDGSYISPSFTPAQAGIYWWTASYSGDTNNSPAASGCDQESVTISQASPGIATAPSATGTGTADGTAVTDTAALAGGDNPTGTIEFKLYGPSATANCSGSAVLDESVKVNGDGSYTTPAFTPSQAGTYWWTAGYSGDTNNNPADTACGDESVTISQASAGIATAPSVGGPVGTAVNDIATLSGGASPAGTIDFKLYGPSATASCSGNTVFDESVTVSGNGTYTSPSFTPSQAGTYWWTASYSGDINNSPAVSGCGNETVTITHVLASPAITTASSAGGAIGATTVTDAATISGGNDPSGTITFNLYGPSAAAICSSSPVDVEVATVGGDGGYATPNGFTPVTAGTYWWTASYSGDTNNSPTATACGDESVIISQASPAIATTPSAGAPIGTTVTDTATLSASYNATGVIEYQLYGPSTFDVCSGTPVFDATVTVSGNGSYTSPSFTPSQAGTYWWIARYSGDMDNDSAASVCGTESVTIGPHLYWSDNTTGTINEANLDGTDPQIIASGQFGPSGVAVSSTNLYWADFGAGTITEANLDGSNPQVIITGQDHPAGVAVNASNLYWINEFAGTIMEANLDGSGVHSIASDSLSPFGVAVNGSNLYWTDSVGTDTGRIMEANLDGTNAHPIVSVTSGFIPGGVAVSSNNLYWDQIDEVDGIGEIVEANLDGTNQLSIGSFGATDLSGMAVNDSNLYWTDYFAGITEANLDGTNRHAIIADQNGPDFVAVGP